MSSHAIQVSVGSEPITGLIRRIGDARCSIDAVVYKCDDQQVFEAIKTASEDVGVPVRLLVDRKQVGKKSSESCIPSMVGLKDVEVRKWTGAKLHAKFTIVDDALVLCGSYNWTKRPKKGKVELLLKYEKRADIRRFRELFDMLWKQGKKVKEGKCKLPD